MADVVVGARLSLDANDGIKSMRDFKAQLKEAKGDLAAMTQQFGLTSDQAREAAKRVAELEDNLGDAKQLVDSFNPDKKFVALGQALNGVLGGFTALTGAMGLLGVESEEVQKQLLKVQSALALSQGLNQIGDSIQSFKNLGKTLVDTLGKSGAIGLAIAGVTALGVAIWQTVSRNKQLEEAQKEYNKALVSARVEVAKVQDAFRQARLGIISKDEALKQYNSTIGQTVGEAKTLNEAEQLTAKNANNYIRVQGLKAKANFLLAESAKISGEAELARLELERNPSLRSASFGLFDSKIAQQEAKAKELENLVAGIENQIKELSGGFAAPSSRGGATTPAGKIAEKETEEVVLRWSSRRDNILLIQQQLADSLKNNRDLLIQSAKDADAQELADRQEFYYQQLAMAEDAAAAEIAIEEEKRRAKIEAAMAVGNALGALSDLVGKQTAAGKVLGIAQATINTFIGATEVLRAKSVLPEPFGTIAKIANVAAIIASGLSAVKNIVKVQVPGYAASGGNTGQLQQVSAPLQAQTPLASRTRLEQDQINQIGNATVRAFVVESDVTNNQERIRRLNRAARL